MLVPAKLITIWQFIFKKCYYMTAEDTIYTFQTNHPSSLLTRSARLTVDRNSEKKSALLGNRSCHWITWKWLICGWLILSIWPSNLHSWPWLRVGVCVFVCLWWGSSHYPISKSSRRCIKAAPTKRWEQPLHWSGDERYKSWDQLSKFTMLEVLCVKEPGDWFPSS